MTIETITHFPSGVFVMTVFNGNANEMTFTTEAEAVAYVAAFNAFFKA